MIIAKKGVIFYHSFPAISTASPESYNTGITPVIEAYYKDGVGAWTSLAIADAVTEIGTTGVYEVDLSATETNHDKVMMKIATTGMVDDAYMINFQDKLVDDLNDLATTDTIANVTLVGTTTLNTDMRGTNNAATESKQDIIDTNVDLILLDTNELQTDWTNGGRLDLIIDAILVDTGTTLNGLLTAVKAKTDSLVFTKANELDSNIQSINNVTLTGDGSGNPFDV